MSTHVYSAYIYIYNYIHIYIYCVYVYNCIYTSPILATLSRSIRYVFYTAVGDSDIQTGPPFGPDLRMDVFEVSGCAGSEVRNALLGEALLGRDQGP